MIWRFRYYHIYLSVQNPNNMVRAIREIAKTILLLAVWGFPVLLTIKYSDARYLFLFGVSLFANISIFSHYETMNRIDLDSQKQIDYETTQETGE